MTSVDWCGEGRSNGRFYPHAYTKWAIIKSRYKEQK
jgi:hypothetical protein